MLDLSSIPVTNPAISLKTEFSRYTDPIPLDASVFTSAGDGSLFYAFEKNLFVYSPSTGIFIKAFTSAREIKSLAAVNFNLLYYIASDNLIYQYTKDSPSSLFTQLNNDTPVSVSAASDGTLWALSSSNNLYTFVNNQWNKISLPDNKKVVMISAGSIDFGAIMTDCYGMNHDDRTLYTYSKGVWEKFQDMNGVLYIGACTDNYWWICSKNLLLLLQGKNIIKFFQPSGLILPRFTASSRYGCFCADVKGIFCNTNGIMEQPPVDWPAMSGGELKAYDSISQNLLITDPGGIRTQYANLNAPLSAYYTEITVMKCPESVDKADWDKILSQVKNELLYAIAIKNLFTNLKLLNLEVNVQMGYTYNEVVRMVELPDQPAEQPSTLIDIALGKLFPLLRDKAISMAPPNISRIITIGMQVYKYASDATSKKHGGKDGDEALKIACSQLAATLAEMQLDMLQTTSDIQGVILKDWGKLQACGQAIVAGIWYWSTDFDLKVLQGVGDATRIIYYQTLMPVKWKIMKFQTVLYMSDPYLTHAPQYSFMYKTANLVWWWWVCGNQKAHPGQDTEGFPNHGLMQAVMSLVTNKEDFFSGQNGWNLPVDMDGYTPPPDSTPWHPYNDSTDPLRPSYINNVLHPEGENLLLSVKVEKHEAEF